MEQCPFCHTQVGEATVCKGCQAYKGNKASAKTEFRLKLVAVLSGLLYGVGAPSFWGGLAIGITVFVIGSLIVQRSFSKEVVWLRKF